MPETTKEHYLSEMTDVTNQLIGKLYPENDAGDVMAWAKNNAADLVTDEEQAHDRIDAVWDEKVGEVFEATVRTWCRALLAIHKKWPEEKKG